MLFCGGAKRGKTNAWMHGRIDKETDKHAACLNDFDFSHDNDDVNAFNPSYEHFVGGKYRIFMIHAYTILNICLQRNLNSHKETNY